MLGEFQWRRHKKNIKWVQKNMWIFAHSGGQINLTGDFKNSVVWWNTLPFEDEETP